MLSVVVGPVFVTDWPARTEYVAAVARATVLVAADAVRPVIAPIAMTNAMATIATIDFELFTLDAPLHAHGRGVSVSAGWSTVGSFVS